MKCLDPFVTFFLPNIYGSTSECVNSISSFPVQLTFSTLLKLSSLAAAIPASNDSLRFSCRLNWPLFEPIIFWFSMILSGTKVFIFRSYFSLPLDWLNSWTAGFHPPDINTQSV